ncbi:MAG: RNA polymerase sigma factor RpoD/SigA [Ignavibacteria bacterium]
MKLSKSIVKYESPSVKKYLQEIGEFELIATKDETELAIKIRSGDKVALNKLVTANLRFVVSVAKQYQNHGLSLGDLINEGNLGLMKAAFIFDETKGFKFISYAIWWIRQAILQAVSEHCRVVRLPLNKVNEISKITKAFNDLEQTLEREPTAEELATQLDMEIEEVYYMYGLSSRQLSFDAPIYTGDEEEASNLLDVTENKNTGAPDALLMTQSLKNEIQRLLSSLTEKEAMIVRLYFGIGVDTCLSLEDLGEKLHLTRERVRQIKESAITKLRNSKNIKNLLMYFE